MPPFFHIYRSTDLLDGKPNIVYYAEADLKDQKLNFTVDTTYQRRLSPSEFYAKNNKPLLVVNTIFFSFAANQRLNVVIKDKKIVAYNVHTIPGKEKDTLTYRHAFGSAIGISKKRKADIAWLITDSSKKVAYASQINHGPLKDSSMDASFKKLVLQTSIITTPHKGTLQSPFKKWKMETAVGGGPVLIQRGEIKITNNEDLKFAGNAIKDKHPRTAMGYTKDNQLIILVIQGRFPGIAEGATLTQEAHILKDIGCWEALNLDGGGSSCLLVNGKETIRPSDKEGQRPVPAVFLIQTGKQ